MLSCEYSDSEVGEDGVTGDDGTEREDEMRLRNGLFRLVFVGDVGTKELGRRRRFSNQRSKEPRHYKEAYVMKASKVDFVKDLRCFALLEEGLVGLGGSVTLLV